MRTVTACARQHFSKEMRRQCSSQALGEGREARAKELPPRPLYPVVGAKQRKPDLGKCVNARPWQVVPFHTTQQLREGCQGHGTSSPCRVHIVLESGQGGSTGAPLHPLHPSVPFLPRAQHSAWDRQRSKHRAEVLSQNHRKC